MVKLESNPEIPGNEPNKIWQDLHINQNFQFSQLIIFFKCCLYMWASMKLVSNALVNTRFIWKSFQKFCKQHETVQEMDHSRNKNKWWACWTQIRYEPFYTTNTLRFEQAFLI